ncbi:MAG: hypothetical protein LCH41_07650 [Armatimonadetes bacterium]|nr:hypothetical protein [Armatimonadota bacterium]
MQVWINDEKTENLAKIATLLEERLAKSTKDLKAFFIVVKKSKEDEQKAVSLADAIKANKLAVAHVGQDESGVSAYKATSPGLKNVVYVYVKRRVVASWANFDPTDENLKALSAAIDKAEAGG